MTRALMIQGTGSDVGKSLITAGLARAFTRRGLRVRPFKPQNMSNNAAVTADGGEIGRAQALQARACGIEPATDMNPVLLKPQAGGTAQIVVCGKVLRSAAAREYRALAPSLLPAVLGAFTRIARGADLVLVEGAGSPAEINLRPGDIANMGFAEAADVPVALVGDIDRGGVIAQLVGTHALLSAVERARLTGTIVNKFRGDPRLFDGGIAAIGERTGLACFGVVPWFPEAHLLPAEDSMALSAPHPPTPSARVPPSPRRRGEGLGAGTLPLPARGERGSQVKIAVPLLPHIANFDDLDPLRAEPRVELIFVRSGQALPGDAALVILPGSKATLADLAALRRRARPPRHRHRARRREAARSRQWHGHRQQCAGARLRDASRRDDWARPRSADVAPRRPYRRRGQRRWPGRGLLSARVVRQRRVPPPISRSARRRAERVRL